jgi:plasmid maintenance system antidote protein VapI
MRALRKYEYNPDYAVAPGITIKETMEEMNIPAKEFASRLSISENSLHRIFRGEQPLTFATANKLEMVTGIPARFWNNSEATYREQLAKIEEREAFSSQIEWLNQIPVKELEKRGVIEATQDPVVTFKSILSFFRVSDVFAWEREWREAVVNSRRSSCFETNPGVAATWIRLGEIEAGNIDCAPYNKQVFVNNLNAIRDLTVKSPDEFRDEIVRLCAEAGVALTFIPEIKGAPWSGATKWLNPNKAMIILSLRGKGEDKFWFSFFHEAGHLVLGHSKKDLLINNEKDRTDPRERDADRFASDFLIPSAFQTRLMKCRSHEDIEALAHELHIAPGIVAGQLHHLKGEWRFFNSLIRRFEWKPASRNSN